jgi:UDP-N-acetylglucosamine 2-epimerase (non-hydrolysing)
VLVVLGTRPEAIKLAPVITALRGTAPAMDVRVCVTGQHREMLWPVLELFGVVPDYDLEVMTPNQKLAGLTSAILSKTGEILEALRPDWVIVQGDTTTALGASLAAFYQGARVAHVEAGLRTHDTRRPFPEEANRRIVDVLCDLYFAPTERARQNLLREGTDPGTVHVVGNTVIDALRHVLVRDYDIATGPLAAIPFERRVVLVTAHRRESFGSGLAAICRALRRLADAMDDIQIVYPVHLNPNVREPVQHFLEGHPRISLIEPLDYVSLVQLMRRSTLILTDSGGIQEEAPSLGKPVLVLREATERPEAVEAGCALIVGTDPKRIFGETRRLLDDGDAYSRMARVANPFGDGMASGRIVNLLRAASKLDRESARALWADAPMAGASPRSVKA